ncbi:early boundary activity protein 1 [Bactrocera oleae]|uniref:early boundary activity protein 1 n=1 Tax=Bactrocera oleae TaxID=104688 RepID=UPI0006B74394|nr:early boundary activity protein 1-like [Bactrocera oleae]
MHSNRAFNENEENRSPLPVRISLHSIQVEPLDLTMPSTSRNRSPMIQRFTAATVTPVNALSRPQRQETQTPTSHILTVITPPNTPSINIISRKRSLNKLMGNQPSQQPKKVKLRKNVPSITDEIRKYIDVRTILEDGEEYVILGANGTKVHKKDLLQLNWSNPGTAITRKLLTYVFGQEILATHTLSGRPSPAFLDVDKPEKGQLNPVMIKDIIEFMVGTKGMMSREVRTSVTTKCADECKNRRRNALPPASAESATNFTLET